jgi:hypothetical protein
MAIVKIGRGHQARKQLFKSGLRRGFLTVQEIEEALPPGALTAAERWLLYYSLRAAEIEIRDETGALVSVPPLSAEELEQLSAEREARAVALEAEEAGLDADTLADSDEETRRIEEALASLEPGPTADHQ